METADGKKIRSSINRIQINDAMLIQNTNIYQSNHCIIHIVNSDHDMLLPGITLSGMTSFESLSLVSIKKKIFFSVSSKD